VELKIVTEYMTNLQVGYSETKTTLHTWTKIKYFE